MILLKTEVVKNNGMIYQCQIFTLNDSLRNVPMFKKKSVFNVLKGICIPCIVIETIREPHNVENASCEWKSQAVRRTLPQGTDSTTTQSVCSLGSQRTYRVGKMQNTIQPMSSLHTSLPAFSTSLFIGDLYKKAGHWEIPLLEGGSHSVLCVTVSRCPLQDLQRCFFHIWDIIKKSETTKQGGHLYHWWGQNNKPQPPVCRRWRAAAPQHTGVPVPARVRRLTGWHVCRGEGDSASVCVCVFVWGRQLKGSHFRSPTWVISKPVNHYKA